MARNESASWPRCWPALKGARRPGPALRSCWSGRKHGGGRPGAGDVGGSAVDGSASGPDRLSAAIEDFLMHLRVERGLADATLLAYRADLLDFAASRGASDTWDASVETPVHYLSEERR